MSKFDRPDTPQGRAIAVYSSLIAGAGILAIGAGLIPSMLDSVKAPPWVILAVGCVFFFAGLAMLASGRAPDWVPLLFGSLICTLFTAIGAWVAWGDTKGQIGGSGVSLAWLVHFDGQALGRFVFALGAILCAAIAAAVWWKWLRALDVRTAAVVLPALGLAGYALFVLMPAEPRWPDARDDHERLRRYALLSETEGWLEHGNRLPASWHYPPWRDFERWTKAARARLAAARVPPQGADLRTIPSTRTAPVVDGRIGTKEWEGALRIALAPESLASSVLLLSDGKRLYLAADVPADATETGFDQFRFDFHLNLSPWLNGEWVSLSGNGRVGALRTVRVAASGKPPKWRTDWRIYDQVRGATMIDGHRRYELAIDLQEAGIMPGAAFPARLSIEGDPVRDARGRFKARTSLGTAGGGETLWLRVAGG